MGGGVAGAGLAALLTELKSRSELSYEQLGRKAHLSRSTVHRYCTGLSVPATFAPVEALGNACGASRDELARLYRLWERAPLGRASLADVGEPVEPVAGTPRRGRKRPRIGLSLVAALALVLLAGGSLAAPPDESPESTPAAIQAPMWTRAPRAISPEFIGVTTNTDTGLMPSFQVGSVRFWDSYTLWQALEPARQQYDWSTLDILVEGAEATGLPMVFTFGGTPDWASPNGPRSSYKDGSRTSPPDNLVDWVNFVRATVVRFRGRIGAYELWDMANHPAFFSGSMADMAEMVRLASQVIRAIDPDATVVCPSMGELWDPAALDALRRFAELGGYRHCDAGSVKLTPRTASDPPETMLPLAHEIENALHDTGTGIELWSTGTAYDVPRQKAVDPDRGADYAVRFFLAGLYVQYGRMYFYNWGGGNVPIVLQPAGGPQTKAARYVDRLHRWLTGSRIHSCGQGRTAGLQEGLWQCRFDRDGETFLIWWTIDGDLRLPALDGAAEVEHLDGTAAAIEPGDAVVVTGSPILLRVG